MSGMQYLSIALLGFGVAFIHLSEYNAKMSAGDEPAEQVEEEVGNQILGLISVLICCFTSGMSGVYFEYILKKSPNKASVHCRNFHLASWSLLLAIIGICTKDIGQVMEYGLFHGFDAWVVFVVVNQGMTGFVVSMMIKYADTGEFVLCL
jgi:UDP-sugar transporter A1/2/3